MRKCTAAIFLTGLLLIGYCTGSVAWAQAGGQPPSGRSGNPMSGSPLGWQIEPIIEVYVRNMSRHYDLTSEQEEYTRQLMNKRVKQFLKDYEKDARSLFAEYYYYQVNKQMPSPELARDWARRTAPLASAIRKEIFDGNMEWRHILNEGQRGKHDRDLELMKRQFDQFDQQLDRWSKGEVRREDITGTVSHRPIKMTKCEDAWEYRVRSFIVEYNLDAGQQQTAYSILRELKDQAGRYREEHKQEFQEMEAKLAELSQGRPMTTDEERKNAREEHEKLEARQTDLERVIRVGMSNQLLARLDRIPTSDQRRTREARLHALNVRGGRATTAPATTTQPAGTTSRPAVAETRPAATSEPAVAANP